MWLSFLEREEKMDYTKMEQSNLTIQEFAAHIAKHLFDQRDEMKERYEASYEQVTKNNGLILHGIAIKDKESNVAPTIYVEKLYEDYGMGRDLDDCMKAILSSYENHKDMPGFNIEDLRDYDKVKDHIRIQIVNREKNMPSLHDRPYFNYGDLAVTFYVRIGMEDGSVASAKVRESELNKWGITPEELLTKAKENMGRHEQVSIKNIAAVMADIIGGPVVELEGEEIIPMYVMSNKENVNGANTILAEQALHDFADNIDAHLYVLPSSIHETILVPARDDVHVEELKGIVQDINRTMVAVDEVLSDSVYLYDKDKRQLMIADTLEVMELKDPKNEKVFLREDKADKREKISIKEKLTGYQETIKNEGTVEQKGISDKKKDACRA